MNVDVKPMFIEIANSKIVDSNITHILFDFDGTLSLIRAGWQLIMQDYFENEFASSVNPQIISRNRIKNLVQTCIEQNTGKQTIYQCIELANIIKKYGGNPKDIWEYKREYQKRLLLKINYRLVELSENSNLRSKYLLPGSLDLLESLRERGITLFLASGTDQEDVKNEARLLGIDEFFGANIFGARHDYKNYSKKKVIEKILYEYSINPAQLLGIGDGYVEIENVKNMGGFTCAVCSDESGNGDLNKWKYKRLKQVGADMFISDYRDIESLHNIWF